MIAFELILFIIFMIGYVNFERKYIEKDKLENPYKYLQRKSAIDPYNMSNCIINLDNVTIKGLKDYPDEPTPKYPS